MRVVFATAPDPSGAMDPAGRWVPLALVHLAGAARAAGHGCTILDAVSLGLSQTDAVRHLADVRPNVLCVSAATAGFPSAQAFCRAAQGLGVTTVVGGTHASFMYPEFLPQGGIDFAVVGEGEETLPELLHCLEAGEDPSRIAGIAFPLGGRIVRTARRPRLATLDPLPKAWDLLDWSTYTWGNRPGSRLAAIVTSRGCPRHCTYCSQATSGEGSWRPRSPDSVAYEMSTLRRDHGADVVALFDEAPTVDARRWNAILERVAELDLGVELLLWSRPEDVIRDERELPRWRAAGVAHVGLCRDVSEDRLAGREAEVSLDMGRRAIGLLRDHGISTEANFWLGFPDETPEQIAALRRRAREWDPDMAHFLIVAPLPYTPAWRALGPHVATRDYRRFDHRQVVLKTRAMTAEQVQAAAVACTRNFYVDKIRRTDAEPPAGRPGSAWRVYIAAPSFRDRLLEGATEEERDALAPRPPPAKA
ncbi:MAG TPA: cobalamin-dependent protein [Anaeromyxobacteraceae bacterium]|nr:cobalamin-dependent protein [Anaeromyxobacteraceae bacterium]